ncbi:peroxiredoxin [Pseudodesulfovibrio sediminis]|uniref:Thioredoxin domain-containing protein n=1 Tax=Pseudodesulfovibrio sediminis TaxID=2810563 RepID=A0ABM7P9S6_9BACT|nr:peroxiredoxin [Pseudodesulfovibrio sediminis]BCS89734.1 hypothetical protein PSDVSF_29760 [Pseudodesulfovibrio sediminis]
MNRLIIFSILSLVLFAAVAVAGGKPGFEPVPAPHLAPNDSVLKVNVGDTAPDFALPSVKGEIVRLSDFKGRKNVVISFVPAAWTPVCSDQWPGYNLALEMIKAQDAELIGISVDNLPSQISWINAMGGLDFTVLSDFWPHGATASQFGVLRHDGMAERALFVIDKQGVIRFIDVHDINKRPDLGALIGALEKVNQ